MSKCKATKRNGNPCKQSNELTKDGYCKYHDTPKYRTNSEKCHVVCDGKPDDIINTN